MIPPRGAEGPPRVHSCPVGLGLLPRPLGRQAVSPPRLGPSRAARLLAESPSWQLLLHGPRESLRDLRRTQPLFSRAPLTRPGPSRGVSLLVN